jgi:hypothetical protein
LHTCSAAYAETAFLTPCHLDTLPPCHPATLLLFVIVQKCGTTSMAAYLTSHPAISGLAGMPGNETFQKESHFFGGILGRGAASSSLLYKSFFPSVLTR